LTVCPAHGERPVGNCYLVAVDGDEDMSLSCKLESGDSMGVVPPAVFAAGYSDSLIIAKQYSVHDGSINKRLAYDCIVPLKFKVRHAPDENRIGPLSEKEFNYPPVYASDCCFVTKSTVVVSKNRKIHARSKKF
jgi:hypothetical protein